MMHYNHLRYVFKNRYYPIDTGKLFKKVLELESVSTNEVLHVGDNLRSDWFRPKLIGMKAILVKSSDVRKK